MSRKETPAETEETEKGGRKKLFLILGVVLVAAAGAAYFFLFAGSGEAEAAAPEHVGHVALEPILVNLAGGGYLKIGIALDVTTAAAGGGHGGAGIDGSKALDQIISTLLPGGTGRRGRRPGRPQGGAGEEDRGRLHRGRRADGDGHLLHGVRHPVMYGGARWERGPPAGAQGTGYVTHHHTEHHLSHLSRTSGPPGAAGQGRARFRR